MEFVWIFCSWENVPEKPSDEGTVPGESVHLVHSLALAGGWWEKSGEMSATMAHIFNSHIQSLRNNTSTPLLLEFKV